MPPDQNLESSTSTRTKNRAIATDSADIPPPTPRTLHLVMQGKGGIGKTLISMFLAHYLLEQGQPLALVDTDPVNASFSSLAPVPVAHVNLYRGKHRIDTLALDTLIERIATEDADFVVDNGAASFLPFSEYLIENEALGALLQAGRQVVVHAIVVGGSAWLDTAKALESIILDYPPSVRLVVWLNEHVGPVVTDAGRPFEESALYKDHKRRIHGLVRLPLFDDEKGSILQEMFSKKLTFEQAINPDGTGPQMFIMKRQRLFKIKNEMFPQIELVLRP